MLKKLLENNLVTINSDKHNWEEAVAISGELLKQEGYIEQSYIDEIVENVKEHGPYIVLIPGVAMPHATVGAKGVIKTGMSLTIFKENIHFEEDKEARLFFTICTNDSEAHMQNITNLMEFLMQEELVEKLKQVDSIEDVKALVQ
ncbi:MAG TPA: PTS sugar transporter subunit IIA [Erysipelothrix sp.]|nr:PTS sugar transporter subunit IIA [Erysipelothrix sp.]